MSESFLLQLLKTLPPPAHSKAKAKTKRTVAAAPAFAAQGSIQADGMLVEVDGYGALPAPMTLEQAAQLSRLCQPARFGRREKTELDTAVRHTGEIAASALHVQWTQETLAVLQADVAQALGLEAVELHLHNLLVYGPGQFFKQHQDTEKRPGMVATLVLVWPSAHIGGTLCVRLGQEERQLVSQQLHGRSSLRWFAFYADCRHEVLAVEEGWRVALTFDLVLSESSQPVPSDPISPDLKAALERHFGLKSEVRLTPWVLLLDHEYSQHGLKWELLKGADRVRVTALRAAARELGLSLNLALAELHQSWTATADDGSSRRRGPAVDPEPDELIEQSLALDYWVDEEGLVRSTPSLSVSLSDVESLTETGPAHLVNSEYEGYMGNYGETLDYWYRRAALVVQSPLAVVRTKFDIDFDAALANLLVLSTQPHSAATLAAHVGIGAKALAREVARQGRALLRSCAEIAAVLPDERLAAETMRGFAPTTFTKEDAAPLRRLEKARGTAWMKALLNTWTDSQASHGRWFSASWPEDLSSEPDDKSGPPLWPPAFDEVVLACQCAGVSDAWLIAWLKTALNALGRRDKALAKSTPAHHIAMYASHLKAVCGLALAIQRLPGAGNLLGSLLEHVVRERLVYPVETLTPLVGAVGVASSRTPAAGQLRNIVTFALERALAEPLRAEDDHRLVGIRWTCRCIDCAPLVSWAESRAGEPLVLAIAELRRKHVQTQLRNAGTSIQAETLKKGSPYKLQLTKPGDLRRRDELLRQRWSQDLERLRQLP